MFGNWRRFFASSLFSLEAKSGIPLSHRPKGGSKVGIGMIENQHDPDSCPTPVRQRCADPP